MLINSTRGTYEVIFSGLRECFSAIGELDFVITDRNVFDLYSDRLRTPHVFVVEPGEASKSIEIYATIQSWLLASGADRKSSVVALGGGVVGDLAGFVAATYQRGVRLVQVPTSLLAQVDSSVGGKVAVNLPKGKNMVGAFFPPNQVLISAQFLETLPERQWRAGMAEVWKVAFGLSQELYRSLLSKSVDTETMVRTCIDLKRRLVEEDEFELGSARAKLNIGHTIGHALENLGGYRELLHGEAVSIGIVQETRLAESLGIAEKGTAAEVSRALEAEGLPITSPYMKDVEKLIPLMKSDKKSTERRLAFCFITRIGECRLVRDVDEHEVKKVLSSE